MIFRRIVRPQPRRLTGLLLRALKKPDKVGIRGLVYLCIYRSDRKIEAELPGAACPKRQAALFLRKVMSKPKAMDMSGRVHCEERRRKQMKSYFGNHGFRIKLPAGESNKSVMVSEDQILKNNRAV